MYEISLSHANGLQRLINSHVRKGLGLPRCLSNVGQYSNGALSLPSSSPVDEYKCAKVRVGTSESQDPVLKEIAPTLSTGRKWTRAAAVMDVWKSALHHQNIVGHVQQGRGGRGLGTKTPTWQKATTTKHRTMVVEEVRQKEAAASKMLQSHYISQTGLLDQMGEH